MTAPDPRELLKGPAPTESEVRMLCDFIEGVGKKEGWKPEDQVLKACRYLRILARRLAEAEDVALFLAGQLALDSEWSRERWIENATTHVRAKAKP